MNMEKLPLISVIVPVYNVEKWISRCVNSIVNQTYKNLEIILVDDGAKDSSGVLCDKLALSDKRIKVIHKENGGLSDARNAGFFQSSGKYVCFIDSDDWIEEKYIQVLYELIVENTCEIAGCAYRKCEDICGLIQEENQYSCKQFNKEEAMSELIDNSIQQVVWNKLYKRSLIDNISFAKGKYHEDEFWSYQVFAKVNKYVETSYIGYNYFQRADSIMGEKYSLKRLDAVEAKCQRQHFLESNMNGLASKGRKNLLFTCMYHGQLALLQLDDKERKIVFDILENVIKKHKLEREDFQNTSMSHRGWMKLSQWSLMIVCKIRNYLKVGL